MERGPNDPNWSRILWTVPKKSRANYCPRMIEGGAGRGTGVWGEIGDAREASPFQLQTQIANCIDEARPLEILSPLRLKLESLGNKELISSRFLDRYYS